MASAFNSKIAPQEVMFVDSLSRVIEINKYRINYKCFG